jgi:zinc ribbon protein
MLLIFGLRAYFRTIGQGTFHCQRCGGDRPYRHKSGRRWIHVFFIPVIPLDKAGEYVQCGECGTRYSPDVLVLPTMAQMQAALPAGMRAAAITMLRVGDAGSSAARRRVIDAVRGAGISDYDDAAVDSDLEPAAGPQAGDSVADRLNALSAQLAVPAREWFLAEIVRIGLADGALTESERQAARDIAGYLGMTPAQAVGVIALTEEGASAG